MIEGYPKTWLDDDGILCVDFGPHARHTRENQDKIYQRHMELAPGRKSPVLVLLKSGLTSDREAEKFASSDKIVAVISAMASPSPARAAPRCVSRAMASARGWPTNSTATW